MCSRRFVSLFFVFLCAAPLFASAQLAAPNGAQDAVLKSLGIQSGLTQQSDINLLQGGCDQNPYPYLEGIKTGGNVQITPRAGTGPSNFDAGVNPTLACRLMKFFQYAQTRGCNFRINDAYRSAAQQASMCGSGRTGCLSAGKSCHQYGLAVDIVSSGSCMGWARSFLGSKNPGSQGAQQFKIHFAYEGDHLQCIENTYANCSPQTRGCGGGAQINPDLSQLPTGPISSIPGDNMVRNLLGQQPQQPLLSQPSQALPSQAQPALSTPTAAPTSLPTTDVGNNTYVGPSPAPAPTASPSATPVSISPSVPLNVASTTPNAPATSTYDYIDRIAYPTSSPVSVGNVVPMTLTKDVVNTSSRATLTPQQSQQPIQKTADSNQYPAGPVPAGGTFTSEDLLNTPESGVGEPNFWPTLTEALRQALLYALQYLRPFGGVPRMEFSE